NAAILSNMANPDRQEPMHDKAQQTASGDPKSENKSTMTLRNRRDKKRENQAEHSPHDETGDSTSRSQPQTIPESVGCDAPQNG
ncbi:MAG TPA: hypothetical protein VMM56_13250, partial [Planctomycetaceae bacterium]|nr:hypothetical protein [Planctomycetaceae bacterium]